MHELVEKLIAFRQSSISADDTAFLRECLKETDSFVAAIREVPAISASHPGPLPRDPRETALRRWSPQPIRLRLPSTHSIVSLSPDDPRECVRIESSIMCCFTWVSRGNYTKGGKFDRELCKFSDADIPPFFVATESGLSAGTTNVTVHMENVVSAVLSAGRYVGLFPPIHSSRVRKRRELRRVTRGFWCRLPRIEAFRSGSYS